MAASGSAVMRKAFSSPSSCGRAKGDRRPDRDEGRSTTALGDVGQPDMVAEAASRRGEECGDSAQQVASQESRRYGGIPRAHLRCATRNDSPRRHFHRFMVPLGDMMTAIGAGPTSCGRGGHSEGSSRASVRPVDAVAAAGASGRQLASGTGKRSLSGGRSEQRPIVGRSDIIPPPFSLSERCVHIVLTGGRYMVTGPSAS